MKEVEIPMRQSPEKEGGKAPRNDVHSDKRGEAKTAGIKNKTRGSRHEQKFSNRRKGLRTFQKRKKAGRRVLERGGGREKWAGPAAALR